MRKLFYRIDANGDGVVDWDEFSLFMLLENQGSAAIREAEETHVLGKPRQVHSHEAHKKLVQCCAIVPPCGFVTGGRDGIVKLWNCKVCILTGPLHCSFRQHEECNDAECRISLTTVASRLAAAAG
jgi:hypothetical protein